MVFTSYFGNVSKIKLLVPELKIVGICNYECKFVKCQYEKSLAPNLTTMWNFKSGRIDWKDFVLDYYNKLYDLDYRFLKNFSEFFNGCVLCCYEKDDKFCHRSVLRKFMYWYNKTEIVELK